MADTGALRAKILINASPQSMPLNLREDLETVSGNLREPDPILFMGNLARMFLWLAQETKIPVFYTSGLKWGRSSLGCLPFVLVHLHPMATGSRPWTSAFSAD